MTIANGLAEHIHNVRYETLPEDALHWARVAILDTAGVTLADASEPWARIAARVLTGGGSTGPSLIMSA
jgi:2-methylcitrate dehydratase PrpD